MCCTEKHTLPGSHSRRSSGTCHQTSRALKPTSGAAFYWMCPCMAPSCVPAWHPQMAPSDEGGGWINFKLGRWTFGTWRPLYTGKPLSRRCNLSFQAPHSVGMRSSGWDIFRRVASRAAKGASSGRARILSPLPRLRQPGNAHNTYCLNACPF